jgi:hypothetical protein
MNEKQIERFFKVLDRELGEDALAIVTGAAVVALKGRARPSLDVDFEIQLKAKNPSLWQKVEQAVRIASQQTGLEANFAESIDRWGMISLMDYRQHLIAWRHFGALRVVLMDPSYWAIGKLTRFLESDAKDIVGVFERQKVPWKKAAQIWGKALKRSPKSASLILFRKQVEQFFEKYGPHIWGKRFSVSLSLQTFYKAAGLSTVTPPP